MSEYFYGWYYRCQGEAGSAAIIPAVHLSPEKSACSIQVITKTCSLYREFPISQFRIRRAEGQMQIGENLFSRQGVRLGFEAFPLEAEEGPEGQSEVGTGRQEAVPVYGVLRFGRLAEPGYDIMGPFALFPTMECRHAVYSMRHRVEGRLSWGEEKLRFQRGLGYLEGDSGTSFPERYLWVQQFLPQGSFMVAAATIPFGGVRFTGTIGFVLLDGREYRFATYLGATVREMGQRRLEICQGRYRLLLRFPEQGGRALKAPERGSMTRRIRENIAGEVEYTFLKGDQVLLRGRTDQAATEYADKTKRE